MLSILESIFMVSKFWEVFPIDILGMPPHWDIDFCIDLESDTRPISIPLCSMALTELKEVKAQIQEIIDKEFIQPSVSSRMPLFYLLRRRMVVWEFV